MNFKGKAAPIGPMDIKQIAERAGLEEAHLQAFIDVESNGRAYDSEGRPTMLFEPHVFYRNIQDPEVRSKAVAAGLAYKNWGEAPYPSDSYPRLQSALKFDIHAALMACSIGLTQMLVENYAPLGYSTPQEMWNAFENSERAHVEACVRFLENNGLIDDMIAGRWATVARVYNGPQYAKHGYDTRLASAYRQHAGIPIQPAPEPAVDGTASEATIRSVQTRLRALSYYETGRIDGIWGPNTRAAVLAFRMDNGMPLVPGIDQGLLAALMTAQPRAVDPERAATTTAAVRRSGSRTVAAADRAQVGGLLAAAGGATASVKQWFDGVSPPDLPFVATIIAQVNPIIESLKGMAPAAILIVGGYVAYQQFVVKRSRTQDEQAGKHVGH